MFTFDDDGSGTVVRDDGSALPFSAKAFSSSGLRFLRPGQRVRLRLSESGDIEAITIVTLPDPQ